MLISNPIHFLAVAVLVSLAVSFIYTLMGKWSVLEYLQIHADAWFEDLTGIETDFLNKLFSCVFCLGWWLSLVICIFLSLNAWDISYLLIPVFSTPLIRFIS